MKNKLGFYNSIALPLFFWFLLAYLLPLNSVENLVMFLFMALSFYINFYCSRKFFSKDITRKVLCVLANLMFAMTLGLMMMSIFSYTSYIKTTALFFIIGCDIIIMILQLFRNEL